MSRSVLVIVQTNCVFFTHNLILQDHREPGSNDSRTFADPSSRDMNGHQHSQDSGSIQEQSSIRGYGRDQFTNDSNDHQPVPSIRGTGGGVAYSHHQKHTKRRSHQGQSRSHSRSKIVSQRKSICSIKVRYEFVLYNVVGYTYVTHNVC